MQVTSHEVSAQLQQLTDILSTLEKSFQSSPTVARAAASARPNDAQTILIQNLLTMMERQIAAVNAPGFWKLMFTRALNFFGLGLKVNTAQMVAISNADDQIVGALVAQLTNLPGDCKPETVASRGEIMKHLNEVQKRRNDAIGSATWLPMILVLALGLAAGYLGASYGVLWK